MGDHSAEAWILQESPTHLFFPQDRLSITVNQSSQSRDGATVRHINLKDGRVCLRRTRQEQSRQEPDGKGGPFAYDSILVEEGLAVDQCFRMQFHKHPQRQRQDSDTDTDADGGPSRSRGCLTSRLNGSKLGRWGELRYAVR